VLDRGSLSLDDEHVRGRVHALSLTIAAGTSQIQRNIVAERILGLPREPTLRDGRRATSSGTGRAER
jgi:hypothetical protein